MIARRFEDLVTWQLAYRLQEQVFAFTETGPASRDFKFRDQIRDSSRSATRNTSEGFGRYYPKEFGHFLRIVAGSLTETKSHLHDARDRDYLTTREHEQLVRLTLRALKANIRLQAYLRTCKAPIPFARKNEPTEPREPCEPCEPREPREPT